MSAATNGSEAAPRAAASAEEIAKVKAIEQARLEIAARPRPPRKPIVVGALLPAAIALALVVVVGAGYGFVQWRASEQRKAAAAVAAQAAADKQAKEKLAAQKAAEQAASAQASQEASQQAAIAEGKLVSVRIAALKELRSQLDGVMTDLKSEAKSSSAASRRWDNTWASRRSSYASRRAAAVSHNASERSRYYASKTEVSSNGKLVVKYTYNPSYVGLPSAPSRPGPLKYSVASEKKRLQALQKRVSTLRSTIASDVPAVQTFQGVYQVLGDAAKALSSTVRSATAMSGDLVVHRGAKGRVIDASRIARVKLSGLNTAMGSLDTTFSAALTAAGLTPEQVAVQ